MGGDPIITMGTVNNGEELLEKAKFKVFLFIFPFVFPKVSPLFALGLRWNLSY